MTPFRYLLTRHLTSTTSRISGLAMVLLYVAPILAQAVPPATPAVSPVVAAPAFARSGAAGQSLHLIAGRSMVIDTANRVKRVYVGNPLVLDSYNANPHEIVVSAKSPGTSSVILWDEMGSSQTYQVSSDVDVEDLAQSLRIAFPVDDVRVHSRENHVVLTGVVSTDAKSDAALKLATMYSKEVTNSLVVNRALIKQVKLKVRILEVDRSKMDQFGLNFFSQGGSLVSNTTTQQYASNPVVTPPTATTPKILTVTDPLNYLIYSAKLNIGATLKDLENKQVLEILAEPNITTLSGEKANFLAGGEFPFPVIQGSSGGLTSITIQFRSYGVKLEFTPFVNIDGSIEMRVAPEVSALDYTNAVTISGYTIPAISTRKADTQVTLLNGQTFAISGLLDQRATDLFNSTPGIQKVPILREFLSSKGTTLSRTELVVLVTPEVVDPLTQTIPIDEPRVVVPFLDPPKFDKSLPKSAEVIKKP